MRRRPCRACRRAGGGRFRIRGGPTLRIIVVGAGAWGLPSAAELATRGHQVTLIDRFGVANTLSSSYGPTRMWRIPDPDPGRVRLSRLGLEAMKRLSSRAGTPVFRQKGILWRDTKSLPRLRSTLLAEGVDFTEVESNRVAEYLPGLAADGRDAIWQKDAGVVLAEASLQAQLRLFSTAGGTFLEGRSVVDLAATSGSARATLADGTKIEADVVVLAAGPGSNFLLPMLGLSAPLRPYLEQVVHFGDADRRNATENYPCFFDGPHEGVPGIYAMSSPGIGYKVGLDRPLRDYLEGDPDRTPDEGRTNAIRERVRANLTSLDPDGLDAQVCVWTDTPDGQFIIDSPIPGVVVACGDAGEGFKYSALMGIIAADLAENKQPEADISPYRMSRFEQHGVDWGAPTALGR
ncbi:NAD(P)/FAD-dependent oxidoreductase [Arthrobacter mobilis]|uniref:NAD(P)/FAD-dependent oxidoreductase n=1 Tax=Arthrobacter mobilis TaxID=2724944 RepID=UPI00197C9AAA|nr:FAD-dependent oxidoreductase [Arthrobacter mobilis]